MYGANPLSNRYSSAARVLILAEAGDTVSAAEGDYVWYTPATAPEDYCAQLQKR